MAREKDSGVPTVNMSAKKRILRNALAGWNSPVDFYPEFCRFWKMVFFSRVWTRSARAMSLFFLLLSEDGMLVVVGCIYHNRMGHRWLFNEVVVEGRFVCRRLFVWVGLVGLVQQSLVFRIHLVGLACLFFRITSTSLDMLGTLITIRG